MQFLQYSSPHRSSLCRISFIQKFEPVLTRVGISNKSWVGKTHYFLALCTTNSKMVRETPVQSTSLIKNDMVVPPFATIHLCLTKRRRADRPDNRSRRLDWLVHHHHPARRRRTDDGPSPRFSRRQNMYNSIRWLVKVHFGWINSSSCNAAANFSDYFGTSKHSPIPVVWIQTNSLTHR